MSTITRKIHFFKMEMFQAQVSSSFFTKHSDPISVIEYIQNLQFMNNKPRSRYMYFPNNDVCFLEVDNIDAAKGRIMGKMALSRRSALPELEQQGTLTSLNIPPNSGLAELTHFVYYPNKDIIGIEFNFYGPRSSIFRDYIQEKSKYHSEPVHFIRLNPILNLDVEQTLQRIGEVNMLQIELDKNSLFVAEELDANLKKAFEAAAEVTESETVEIVFRKKKYKREGFGFPFLKSKIIDFLKNEQNRESLSRFKVVSEDLWAEDKKARGFDLLEDKLVSTKKIIAADKKGRNVDSNSMYDAIETSFMELKENFISDNND
ncbi:hypothetical protein P4S95_26725 [Aneurinibacillus aneurinilyticus]|uniref:hypothetical protein n=1 Tax=Aneurinibacillus aneurinilyticus TaxID=1391 RepID=UPI002E2278F6|nr:hypothetical protein [Aneurinibacillus aneurinilyticus]